MWMKFSSTFLQILHPFSLDVFFLQFEQTMVVTDKGVEVLTARPGGKAEIPHFMEQLESHK